MTQAMPSGVAGDGGSPAAASPGGDGYWDASQRPWVCLIFLLPLVIAYELGTAHFTSAARHGWRQHIVAFDLLREFFTALRAPSPHMPAMALGSILVWWHLARGDPWTFRFSTLLGMAAESVALAVPVLSLGFAFSHCVPLAGTSGSNRDLIIFSFGAGVYEEMIFRLILLTVLSLILRDCFQLGANVSGLLMVVTSGVLFATYHYLSPHDIFSLRTFLFRTIAGAYFAILFLTRGFGITSFSHAAYDVIVVFSTSRVFE